MIERKAVDGNLGA